LLHLKAVCPHCKKFIIMGEFVYENDELSNLYGLLKKTTRNDCPDIFIANKTYGHDKLTINQMHSNRQVADAVGHSHYFLGTTCKRGHIAPRLVSSSSCYECEKIYYKQSRKKKGFTLRHIIAKEKPYALQMKNFGPDKLSFHDMKSTRKEALKFGHSHYFTGRFCQNGHLTPRTTGNYTCIMCIPSLKRSGGPV